MSGAIRIETTQWRVAQDGVSEFASEEEARRHAAGLNRREGFDHLGVARVQSRKVTITTGHWADDPGYMGLD